MFLVKLLPKAFLALGTNYGIDSAVPCAFWVAKVETHPWNSAFSLCIITDSGSREGQGLAKAAVGTSETIDLWLSV